MVKAKIGFALCGSFCTFEQAVLQLEQLSREYDITPIMSQAAYSTSTRFAKAELINGRITGICGKPIISTIKAAEPIGPKQPFDLLVIAPCTGNTLAKLANGITDTSVTMAAKAHLRNNKPLLIAISTNDALGASARNIGSLLNTRNIYFVPFNQDDALNKPRSMVADLALLPKAIAHALKGEQVQPIIAARLTIDN